jgi:putative tryptophan/tyrosine transport system substrate-binding protein
MMRRRHLLIALGSAVFAPHRSLAQQTTKFPRIGYISGRAAPSATNPDPNAEALRQGLRELGYIESKNIFVEYRYVASSAERSNAALSELANVDVLILPFRASIEAAKQLPRTPPVVMVTTEDPVKNAWVGSLAHPGGNITGVTRLTTELSSKRLDLLKELLPGLARISVLVLGSTSSRDHLEAAARANKLQLSWVEVHAPNPDYESAFQAAVSQRTGAFMVRRNPLTLRYQKQIGELTLKYRLPTMCEGTEEVAAGSLISYASSDAEAFRRAASYVDRILKGAKPGDLPIEQPAKFEIALNMKTAQTIGIKVPQSLYLRADRIFE